MTFRPGGRCHVVKDRWKSVEPEANLLKTTPCEVRSSAGRERLQLVDLQQRVETSIFSIMENHPTKREMQYMALSINGGYPQMDGLFHGKSSQNR